MEMQSDSALIEKLIKPQHSTSGHLFLPLQYQAMFRVMHIGNTRRISSCRGIGLSDRLEAEDGGFIPTIALDQRPGC